MKYTKELIQTAHALRAEGKSYLEITRELQVSIPKSTLANWCKDLKDHPLVIKNKLKDNKENLFQARILAHEVNKNKRNLFLEKLKSDNINIAKLIKDAEVSKIALSMLCLGEASKYSPKTKTSFTFGNSNPKIINLFLVLLKKSCSFSSEKIRCTVQCRADQDISILEEYWQNVTGIPKTQFYTTRVDPRALGKPARKPGYMGVLRIDYLDRKVQLELECLAELVWSETTMGL